MTVEALKHRHEYIKEVILSTKANRNKELDYLLGLCDEYQINVTYDDHLIDKLSLKENCYCIGVFDKFYTSLENRNHIVLYGFTDYGDLGTILRSSVSFNFKDIVLIGSDIDYFDPACVRASMGSLFHVNIERFSSIETYLNEYPDQNLYPFLSEGNIELRDISLKEPYSIVISEKYDALDEIFDEGYYLKHNELDEISLSIRSSIILSRIYHQTLNGRNI